MSYFFPLFPGEVAFFYPPQGDQPFILSITRIAHILTVVEVEWRLVCRREVVCGGKCSEFDARVK